MDDQKPTVLVLTGGIHTTQPVSVEPEIDLSRWSARKLPDGDVHLVGWNIRSGEGRVSNTVKTFDAPSATVTTSTGRRYFLRGAPGSDPDAEYVWNGWRLINHIEAWEDVTDSLWTQIEAARSFRD